MKKKSLLLLFAFLIAVLPVCGKTSKSVKDLPTKYRKWVEEEVVYIISPKEKEIFLQFESDRERDSFIKAFWKQRDPTPGTPKNEFKDEHYRRLDYANKFLGRGTPRPGWKTDRGRIYIILGEPLSIDRYEGQSVVYPAEIWFYKGEQSYGLPPYFSIVFFKKKGIGEYKLYSPITDGMQELIIDKRIAGANPEIAYSELYQYDAELAQAALSLIPDENPSPSSPSLSSEILLANVSTLPHKKVDSQYAERLLRYKDIVEVDYTANYISSDSMVSVMQDNRGIFYVNFAIEPKSLSVDLYNDKYIAHFELNGMVTDFQGKTIFQYDKSYSLELTEGQLQQLKISSFSIQDSFPLIPGSYKFSVILKNTISKEFTSFEEVIHIPLISEESSFQMSPILLGYQIKRSANLINLKRPFGFREVQISAQPKNLFTTSDRLYVFFQMYNTSPEIVKRNSIKITLLGEEKELFSETRTLAEFRDKRNFLLDYPLNNYKPGFYKIRVSLYDDHKNEVLFEEGRFQITLSPKVARPWVISRIMPINEEALAEVDYMLASQHLAKGNRSEAKEILENIYRQTPRLKYAFRLSEIFYAERKYKKVKEILTPYRGSSSKNYEWLALLGKALQATGEYEGAIRDYKEYLAHTGTNLQILNAIGDCYYMLQDKEQALIAWKKSLELNPDQPDIKKKVDGIKK